MQTSLIGTTYDLLSFHEQGTYAVFERCFTKALRYFSIELDDDNRRFLRNWTFHFLRATGYIDVVRTGSTSTWSVSPAALVQRGETDFVLIGSLKQEESLRNVAGPEQLFEIRSTCVQSVLPKEVSLFPNVVQLVANRTQAETVARRSGLNLTCDYQEKMFSLLPSICSVFTEVLVEWQAAPVFESDTVLRYDAEQQCWQPYHEINPLDHGLYKTESKFAKPQYFIAERILRSRRLKIYRVIDEEWAQLAAAAKLHIKIPLRYESDARRLLISGTFEKLRLPTILERCLRSGTLVQPEVIAGRRIYENIAYKNIWRLVAKLPLFEVEKSI